MMFSSYILFSISHIYLFSQIFIYLFIYWCARIICLFHVKIISSIYFVKNIYLVHAMKRQRCPFGPKTKELEDSTAGTKKVRSNWSGVLLCNQCNVSVCNVHSANLCPNCFQHLKYGNQD